MRLSKGEQKAIAQERISYLFSQAEQMFPKDRVLADRYIELALELRDKFKCRLTKAEKARFCKECHAYLMPGATSYSRTKNRMLLIHCKRCGAVRKFGMG